MQGPDEHAFETQIEGRRWPSLHVTGMYLQEQLCLLRR